MDTICKFCENNYREPNKSMEGNWYKSEMTIINKNLLDIDISAFGETICDNFTIKYCPMCGREL